MIDPNITNAAGSNFYVTPDGLEIYLWQNDHIIYYKLSHRLSDEIGGEPVYVEQITRLELPVL